MKESYLMIKPDGQRYLPEIETMIIESGLQISRKYYVDNWRRVSKCVYKKCIQEHDDIFRQEFEGHVWLNNYMFGNEALVFILKKENLKDEELLQKIMDLKKNIRKKFDATKNGTFMIIMDINKIGLENSEVMKGRLCIQNGIRVEVLDEMISQIGLFRTFFFQYVHCPDANLQDAESEMNILRQEGVISSDNLLNEEEWNKMKYYRRIKK